jgi:2-oxoacid:acceptor oxidoreductase gamma subunit (pyruvate/2-ketoisovalerate family)
MEIRLHGRGGQGGVTCAKILATTYARLGKHVQTFGDYAGERSGAPVRAYTRVEDRPITNRNKVYRPDHLIVLDQNLLGADTIEGLRTGGDLLLNTPRPMEELNGQFPAYRLAAVDATAIARRHGIGTRSVVIVNTTIAGAFARLREIPLPVLEAAYRALGLLSNFPAAREAYEAVQVRQATDACAAPAAGTAPAARPPVEPVEAHVESPPTGLRTGTWSSQRPRYVEHLAPCNAWCPAGNDVVGFVQAVAVRGEEAAAAVLAKSSPLPGTCGRVCPAPCMEGCNRAEYDGAVNIRGIERWISDHAPAPSRAAPAGLRPLSIAVVGGGPAGLAAAHSLALLGHRARVFEGERELGGILVTGIPAYRLPRDVVRREVARILDLGVEARCGEFLSAERLREIAREHDGLVLATGLQAPRPAGVRGDHLAGVEQGIAFLHRVNLGEGARLEGRVVVLGGGNTAMDCARSALRLGAARVTVAYRRTRQEMPAIREEIEEAEREGVEILLQRQPVGFRGNGRLQSVDLAEVDMGEPDASGRRRPVVTARVASLACDRALLALGQSADRGFLPPGWELRGQQVFEDGRPLPAFAAGDFATGDGTVAHAIGSGRRAATLLLRALGRELELFERPERSLAVPATDIRFDHFERRAAAPDRHVGESVHAGSFGEVALGLPDGLESHRCFSCGHCTHCDTCLVYCPEGVVRRAGPDYDLDYAYCKGCGICVHECPRSGMEMSTP